MQISSSKSISSKTLQERCLQTQNLPALTHNFARKDPTQLHILPLQQCELNPDTWLKWRLRMWWWYRKPHSITTSTNTSSYYACWHQSAGSEISVPSPFFINLPNPASTCAPRKWRPAFPMIFTFSMSQVFLEPYFSYNILPNHH
jgi:hypothetical protein